MANYKWNTTSTKGLFYRLHPTRKISKGAVGKDRFYQYRMMVDRERVRESFGWESEWVKVDPATRKGRSFEVYCVQQIEALREARRTGKGPGTLAERKSAEKERRAAEKAKLKLTEREKISFNDVWENDHLLQKLLDEHQEQDEDSAIASYLTQAKADRGENALDREISIYNLWIKPVIGKRAMPEIAPIHLEKIKSNMNKAGRAPRSIQYALAIVRQVFNFAINYGMFDGSNPVRFGKKSTVKLPTFDNKRTRFLTRSEASQLLEALKDVSGNTHDHVLMSLHTGMRAGEIWALTWADVDLDRGILTLRDTKNGHTRPAFMTSEVKAMLRARRPATVDPTALVFPGRGGVKIKQASDSYDRTVEKLGLNDGITDRRQKVTFHTLRHTFASWLVENGTDLYAVKELLGHSDIKMTTRYAHLGESTLQAAVKNLDASFHNVNHASNKIDEATTKIFELAQAG
jgi:integrase